MTSPDGGFYSTQDADSEGEEGKFYVWTMAEIERILGAEVATTFCRVYDVTAEGNFEATIFSTCQRRWSSLPRFWARRGRVGGELHDSRQELLEVRNGRIWPGLDDKVLVSWNGLMIDALASAGVALGEPRYLQAAQRAAEFLLSKVRRADGRLLHSYRLGQARFDAYLDDYACLANALVTLYESDFDERWIDEAVPAHRHPARRLLLDRRLAAVLLHRGTTMSNSIARNKELTDSSTPSGNAPAAT